MKHENWELNVVFVFYSNKNERNGIECKEYSVEQGKCV